MKKRLLIPLLVILTLLVGVFAVAVVAANSDPSLTITGANLEFDERVYMLFAVDSDNISDTENVKLLVFRGDVNADTMVKGKEVASLNPGSSVKDGSVTGNVYTYNDVAAAEMTEDIYVRAYYADSEGTVYYSDPVKYSILQYACNKLGYTGTVTTSELLKEMLTNMLAYGASAQKYFNHNTDRLATDSYVKITLENATMADGFASGLVKKGERFDVSVPTSADSQYVVWTDKDGKTVAAGTDQPIVAVTNRTFVANTQASEPTFGSYKYVVIVGVDGAGSFYPNVRNVDGTYVEDTTEGVSLTPNIDAILDGGAKTYTMRVASPTASSVSWMSCLHGVKPENHGNTENIQVENGVPYTMDSNYPSILRVVKEARPDAEVGAIYNWIGITGIVESAADTGITNERISGQENLVKYIESGYVSEKKPTLLYLHLNNPDSVGHSKGHHTPEYYACLEETDAHIGRIYDAYEAAGMIEDTLFIVTSDHGGVKVVNSSGVVSGTHGNLTDVEKYVLFGAAGKTVKENGTIDDMYIRDTASIVLHALGVEVPDTYTSIIPNNLFPDVTDMVRKEYHDPDLPRYHEPVATPAVGSDGFVDKFVDNDLAVYLPFDGNTDEANGAAVDTSGIITYEDGYFGQGVQLEDGHMNVHANFAPGTNSFTIATWAKFATPDNGLSPMISTKGIGSSASGFVFSTGRYASVERQDHYGAIEFGTGSSNVRYTGGAARPELAFPSDYIYGWMHVMIEVNKDEGLIKIYYDFEEAFVIDMPASVMNASLTSAVDYITLGNDITGAASAKSGVAFDEFMIFNGVLDNASKAGLMEYYGLEGYVAPEESETIGDIVGADVYFGFEGVTTNDGSFDTDVSKYGTLEYFEGKNGQSLYLDGTDYFTLDDVKLGSNSFAMATWIKPTDLNFYSGKYRLPILSTSNASKRESYGINVFIDAEYGCLTVTIGDGTDGLQEMYRYYCPEKFVDNTDFNIHPHYTELNNQWMHIAVSVNKDTNRLHVYVDFEEVLNAPLRYYGGGSLPSDLSFDYHDLTVGQYGAPVSYGPNMYIDDLMIFKRSITESDIAAMEKYYRAPLSDFIDKAPVLDFDFDGNVENKGTYDGAIEQEGTITYGDGYYGTAGFFNTGSVDIQDLVLSDNSMTVSMWFNTAKVKYSEGGRPYRSNLFATAYKAESDYEGLHIDFSREYNCIFVHTQNATNSGRGYVMAKFGDEVKDNEWVHITVVINPDPASGERYVTVYINFKEVETYSDISTQWFGKNTFDGGEGFTPHIGADGQGNLDYNANGYIDEFLFFDGTLTAEEVAKLAEFYGYDLTEDTTTETETE